MTSIRTSILFRFFLIILTLSIMSLVSLGIHYSITARYSANAALLVTEAQLENQVGVLTQNYRLLSSESFSQQKNTYVRSANELQSSMSQLDTIVTTPQARIAYMRYKSVIEQILSNGNNGLSALQNGNTQEAQVAKTSMEQLLPVVTSDSDYLLRTQFNETYSTQNSLLFMTNVLFVIWVIILLLIIIVSFATALTYSHELVESISAIERITKAVATGYLNTKVDDTLLARKDEIGQLSHEFNDMIHILKENVTVITESNKHLFESKAQIEKKNEELERFNKLTVDRELRMLALKEEIKGLKEELEALKEHTRP